MLVKLTTDKMSSTVVAHGVPDPLFWILSQQ
jgi:hypothetical protein